MKMAVIGEFDIMLRTQQALRADAATFGSASLGNGTSTMAVAPKMTVEDLIEKISLRFGAKRAPTYAIRLVHKGRIVSNEPRKYLRQLGVEPGDEIFVLAVIDRARQRIDMMEIPYVKKPQPKRPLCSGSSSWNASVATTVATELWRPSGDGDLRPSVGDDLCRASKVGELRLRLGDPLAASAKGHCTSIQSM